MKTEGTPFLQKYNGQNVRKSGSGVVIYSVGPFEHTFLLALAVMLSKSLESRSAPMRT
jgi:hypothetical protein